ncbi:acyl-CoA N-acyltransferase [Dichotomopilus funicola]|uniref:Acyl-CoA N-acyltransferase n=1 Tax=Dichotomopilus funicola TaxID=1934379 RepID=A0AAN6UZG8_9PEZI|nr:acyl-CoA N-acyltransferase [Dichotomopilus funicola]
MITLRPLTPSDWPLWRRLRLHALSESPHAFGATLAEWQGPTGDLETRWRARLSIPGSRNFVAFLSRGGSGELDDAKEYEEGEPVGMGSGVPVSSSAREGSGNPDGEGVVEVISVWVHPKARGKGVGDRLLQGIEAWAVGEGKTVMRLSVMPSNAAAVGLYRRNGLRETGREGDEPAPGREREVEMEKVLTRS